MEYVKLKDEEYYVKGTSHIINKIKRHKFISMIIAAFIVFSILNFVMIYKFMEILQNI
ncbi:MAG: hypothetical protein IJH39_10380 [Clostridia bacterium]|nr:hypothetical protein [Clostridia bacterium]